MNQTPLQVINDFLASEAEKARTQQKYPADHWRASSAGYCMRKTFYERKQVPHIKKEDARGLRVLSAGNIFHDWAKGIVAASYGDENVHAEMEILIPDLNVVGHVDNILKLEMGWMLVDYKSQHSNSFWYGEKNGSMVKPHQRLQVGTYLFGLQEKFPGINAVLEYISKDDLTMVEAAIPWTPMLKVGVEEYWGALNDYWAKNELPPCTCEWERRYCAYGDTKKCCSEDLWDGR